MFNISRSTSDVNFDGTICFCSTMSLVRRWTRGVWRASSPGLKVRCRSVLVVVFLFFVLFYSVFALSSFYLFEICFLSSLSAAVSVLLVFSILDFNFFLKSFSVCYCSRTFTRAAGSRASMLAALAFRAWSRDVRYDYEVTMTMASMVLAIVVWIVQTFPCV